MSKSTICCKKSIRHLPQLIPKLSKNQSLKSNFTIIFSQYVKSISLEFKILRNLSIAQKGRFGAYGKSVKKTMKERRHPERMETSVYTLNRPGNSGNCFEIGISAEDALKSAKTYYFCLKTPRIWHVLKRQAIAVQYEVGGTHDMGMCPEQAPMP